MACVASDKPRVLARILSRRNERAAARLMSHETCQAMLYQMSSDPVHQAASMSWQLQHPDEVRRRAE
jgi:hypothetical protein